MISEQGLGRNSSALKCVSLRFYLDGFDMEKRGIGLMSFDYLFDKKKHQFKCRPRTPSVDYALF